MAEVEAGHPWFAAVFDRLSAPAERGFMRAVREDLIGSATGRVLEIGCGTGASFPYYHDSAAEVWATEPDPYMLERARKRAAEIGKRIDIRQARAEDLPFADRHFDTVISTLVLCTVADPARALAEVKRVLRADGELRFCEHVRFENRVGALVQDLITPVWRRVLAGCHPNRDLVGAIRDAGFQVTRLERVEQAPLPVFVKGVARPARRAS